MADAYLQNVTLHNFKCFRDTSVDLSPLTVLIGKNDTGKSSFLDSISFAAWMSGGRNKLDTEPFHTELTTRGCNPEESSLTLQFEHGSLDFSPLEYDPLRSNLDFDKKALQNVQPPYCLEPHLLRLPTQVGSLEKFPLPYNGLSLVAALDRFSTNQFVALQSEFITRVPTITEIRLESPSPGFKDLWFEVRGVGRLSARLVSDGAMLLLAFLTIIHDENAPKILLIEEPENGIHPKQLEYIVHSFYSLTKRSTPIQIILTTHSPYILDFVDKKDIRVFTRNESGDAIVSPFESLKGISDMLSSGYTQGEAWYNSDEDELVKQSG